MVYKASHPVICPLNSFSGVIWLLLTIYVVLEISLLFLCRVLTITNIALATVFQSLETVCPQLRQAISLTNFPRLFINCDTAIMKNRL